ncbi:uncharacterized protein LOC130046314 isoform X2 [Ostrea edulis]|nr:uncharacterized protein LOC130046314 isoform X2 [Ostrea edulis]
MVYISLLSPSTDNNPPRKCDQFSPAFGKNCEFRCHCSNSSEVCDNNFGICQSGCIDGWHGNNCQLITSVFDKSDIVANLPSTHLVQCTINKLWYNWSSVYLTVYNTTNILINVSQGGEISASDERLNATLSRATGTEADNVTFKFLFGEDDCDLAGMYRCQFEMLGNFHTSYANLSISVQGKSSNLQISTKNVYIKRSTDSINCTLQLADSNADVILTFMDKDNNTLNLTTADEQILFPEAKCTNLTTFIYNFNATQELNQSRAKCTLRSEANGIVLESNGSVINIVSRSVSVVAVMEPKSLEIVAGKTDELTCFVNVSSYKWTAIHLDFHNESLTRRIVTIANNTIISDVDQVKASSSIDSEYVNVTFIFNPLTSTDGCSLSGSYTCLIDLVDKYIATENDSSAVTFTAPLSAIEISADSSYVSGSNSTINCTVDLGDRSNTDVKLEGCQGGTHVDLKEIGIATRDILYPNDDQGVNCTNQIIYRYHLTFMDINNNMLVRCHSNDNLYNSSISTKCVSINITRVQATMEPSLLYGKWSSKATFECKIPLSEIYFSTFQFFNDSTSPLLSITAENNFTIPPQNERISAVYTSSPLENYRAVNITFDLRPGDDLCNLIGSYLCRVRTFNESLILPTDDESQLIIAAPPSNVSIEIKQMYVIGGINETINCTAIINLNTTTLSLHYNISGSSTTAPQNITQTIVESEMTDDCRHRVRVVNVFAPNLSLDGFMVVCVASDVIFGNGFRSKEETLNIFSLT